MCMSKSCCVYIKYFIVTVMYIKRNNYIELHQRSLVDLFLMNKLGDAYNYVSLQIYSMNFSLSIVVLNHVLLIFDFYILKR